MRGFQNEDEMNFLSVNEIRENEDQIILQSVVEMIFLDCI